MTQQRINKPKLEYEPMKVITEQEAEQLGAMFREALLKVPEKAAPLCVGQDMTTIAAIINYELQEVFKEMQRVVFGANPQCDSPSDSHGITDIE